MGRRREMMKSALRDFSFNKVLGLLKKTIFLDDHYLIYKANTDSKCRPAIPPIDGIRIEKGNLEEIEKTPHAMNGHAWGFQCYRLDGVEEFFLAKDETGIQHISWIYNHHHHNRLLALRKNEVEIKYCLTMPSSRGRGIYPRVLGEIMDYLEKQEIRWAYMCVDLGNYKSIKGIEKAGFKLVGKVRYRKIFGFLRSKPLIAHKIK